MKALRYGINLIKASAAGWQRAHVRRYQYAAFDVETNNVYGLAHTDRKD